MQFHPSNNVAQDRPDQLPNSPNESASEISQLVPLKEYDGPEQVGLEIPWAQL